MGRGIPLQNIRRKTFKTLAEARKWLHQIEVQKTRAKEEELPYGRIHDGRYTY